MIWLGRGGLSASRETIRSDDGHPSIFSVLPRIRDFGIGGALYYCGAQPLEVK
jgi:hypothetical protein